MQNWRRHSIFWPLLLIAAGVLLFINNVKQLSGTTWDAILRLWPVLLIAAGLDGFWRGEGYAGATVVTGLGVLFLLGNLGYLTFSTWDLILRLWPIILVAIGLDIILGRKRLWSAAVGILIGLVVTAGIFWLVINSSFATNYKTDSVSFNLGQAQTVSGTISMPVGRLNLSGGVEGNQLLSGSLKLNSTDNLTRDLSVSGSTATFNLEGRGYTGFVPFTNSGGQEEWVLQLSPTPTYKLLIKQAVGECSLDLSGLKVTDLTVQTAVGKTSLTLPASGPLTGRIEAAIGETVIYLPKGAPVQVHFNRALTSTSQPPDFTVNGSTVTSPGYTPANGIDLTVNEAIGAINVRYLP